MNTSRITPGRIRHLVPESLREGHGLSLYNQTADHGHQELNGGVLVGSLENDTLGVSVCMCAVKHQSAVS